MLANKASYSFIFKKTILNWCFIGITALILSCKNEVKQDAAAGHAISTDSTVSVDTSIQVYPVWILEFQKLRQALYQNDIPVVSTYFNFPLTDEQSDGLSAAIYFISNTKSSETLRLNSKEQLERYYRQIFPAEFVKALLSIKSDSLLNNKFASSENWKLPNDKATYHSTVSYDTYEKSLNLLLNAQYGNVEEETESAAVYIFKLDKNNKLKFDRVEMAG